MPTYELYYHHACPYCERVLMAVNKLGVEVELRNILRNSTYHHKLLQRGGRVQVPCLRISGDALSNSEDTWLYESSAIIKKLHKIAAAFQK